MSSIDGIALEARKQDKLIICPDDGVKQTTLCGTDATGPDAEGNLVILMNCHDKDAALLKKHCTNGTTPNEKANQQEKKWHSANHERKNIDEQQDWTIVLNPKTSRLFRYQVRRKD